MDRFRKIEKERSLVYHVLTGEPKHLSQFIRNNELPTLSRHAGYRLLAATLLRSESELAKDLLESKVEVYIEELKKISTPLHLACYPANDGDVVEILLSKGAPVNVANRFGETPLHLAAKAQNKRVVEALLLHGADVNPRTNNDETSLHYLMIGVSKDERSRSSSGLHSLNDSVHYHIPRVHRPIEEIVRLLFAHGADVNVVSKSGCTELELSFIHRHNDNVIAALIDIGADANTYFTSCSKTAMQVAAKTKSAILVKKMLESGGDAQAKLNGETLLMMAVCSHPATDTEEKIAILLDYNVDVNYRTNEHAHTVLHRATKFRSHEIIRKLLKAGADPFLPDSQNVTPLDLAMSFMKLERHNFNIFLVYVESCKNIDIDHQDANGDTALHFAFKSHDIGLIQQLLEIDASINIVNNQGCAPIDYFNLDRNNVNLTEEFQRIKETNISNYASLYDLLRDINKMDSHVQNLTLLETLSNDFEHNFPHFNEIINLIFEKGVVRRDLLEKSKDKLNVLSGFDLPSLCGERIFKSFTETHLKLFLSK